MVRASQVASFATQTISRQQIGQHTVSAHTGSVVVTCPSSMAHSRKFSEIQNGLQGATLTKARFLAELQGGTDKAVNGAANPGSGVGGKLAVPIGGFAAGVSAVSAAAAAAAQDTTPSSWDVLKDDYTGLQSGSKMKDWDKREDSDDAPAQETFDDPVQSDSDAGAW